MPKFAPVSEWFRDGRKQERNASLAQLARARDL